MWQDYIISVGAFLFIISLIPSIKSQNKPDLKTSIPIALVLFIFTITYISLELWLAALTNFGTAISWSILAVQKYKISNKKIWLK
jgi:hypothetical protein